ncbi:hypothetical protein [Candidatus Entotheonella palauensis]|uniref:hypothetical protein n=1 Tax=Candidatus Entotheonella palauensis TaxID=93172 RepID=UPI000B7EFC14|nr:hypothetical protein [Candidatus Entotheonella palauensis]
MGLDFSEEMIRLHVNVEALLPVADQRILQFVASRQGEGTSTLARAYAKVAATEFRKRVLLLDTAWEAGPPSLNGAQAPHGRLSRGSERTVEKALVEQSLVPDMLNEHLIEKTLVEPGDEPYFFFPAPVRQSTVPAAGQALLIEHTFATLRKRFDVVVVDSPPVHKSSYSLVMARQADGVILVVEATRTRWPVARNAKHTIVKAGGNVVGMILNKRRAYIPSLFYKRFA